MNSQGQQICVVCGRVIKAEAIKQRVGGNYYVVDKDECAMILKRFHSVYGNEFCMMLRE
ncbi:MAG TPA: hypothetical protein VHF65_09860 [Nitrososphaera sp.]|nr:hypothetical protein [Nitrososphaera sp.]